MRRLSFSRPLRCDVAMLRWLRGQQKAQPSAVSAQSGALSERDQESRRETQREGGREASVIRSSRTAPVPRIKAQAGRQAALHKSRRENCRDEESPEPAEPITLGLHVRTQPLLISARSRRLSRSLVRSSRSVSCSALLCSARVWFRYRLAALAQRELEIRVTRSLTVALPWRDHSCSPVAQKNLAFSNPNFFSILNLK